MPRGLGENAQRRRPAKTGKASRTERSRGVEDGAGEKRVAMYLRVSTDEQAKSGYSMPDQKRTLLDHAEREGYEVLEIIEDDGWSGASPERPGIRRIYELATTGQIDVVLATKRDRFFRSRLYRLEMDRDMKEHGVKLVSLTDTGNRIGDGVLDDFAEWEREQTAQRTRNGKLEKARKGNVVGGHNRAYGYDWVRDTNGKVKGYRVNEVEMHTVWRIFFDIANGKGIRTVKEELDLEGVPTPGRGRAWSRPFLRDLILDDLYKSHTVDELRQAGVSEAVLGSLDASATYGLYRYEGIPVPIPDAGIPVGVIEEARHRVKSNRSPSRVGHRFWELSGGILYCEECGRRMQAFTFSRRDKRYSYYRCQTTTSGKADRCTMKKNVPASAIEAEVWGMVRHFLDDKEHTLRKLEEHFEDRRKKLSRPGPDVVMVARRLEQIERQRAKYQHAYAADAMSLADLKARNTELDNDSQTLRQELERARNREAELEKLEQIEEEMRERIEGGHRDVQDRSPQERRELYQDLRIRVEVGADARPRISGVFPMRSSDGRHTLYVRNHEASSWRRCTPTTLLRLSHASTRWESSRT
jgi:site-specific DNA recombinase